MASSEAKDILERGYAVFDDAWSSDEVAELRSGIEAIVREVDPPAFYAEQTTPLTDTVAITPTGLAVYRLLHERPDFAEVVLKPDVVEPLREVLGPDMRLELAGAVASDSMRPFFRWHTHIGGEEEGERYLTGNWPRIDEAQRVLTLLYLDELDDDGGPLLVLPRKVGDDTAPPASIDAPSWPGEEEVRASPGTLVAIEQCTWHAAHPKRTEGLRMFVGCYFAAASAPPLEWADDSLRELSQRSDVLRSLVGEPG